MKNKLKFFIQFLKNPKKIGSITPSSSYLMNEIIKQIDFNSDICIFEYGAGDGVFTENIYNKMSKNSKLYIIENNSFFIDKLKSKYKNCKNVEVIYDSVENIDHICKEREIDSIDYIVSGIPFLSLGLDFTLTVLEKSSLYIKHKFILFQYTKKMEKYFHTFFQSIERHKVKKNIPPAYIYCLYK